MKLNVMLLGAALTLWPLSAHEACQHEEEHTHAEEAHTHGDSCCDHDHGSEGHTHTEDTHTHGDSCCDHDHGSEGHVHGDSCGHDHSHDKAPVVIQVDARSRHILNMQVEALPEGRGTLTHSMYGTLTVPEHATETYALPCAGFITLAVKSAQEVKKGDLLYSLSSPSLDDCYLELRKAHSAVERNREELDILEKRRSKLNTIGVANSELESQLSFKRAELRQAQDDASMAESRLRLLQRGNETAENQDGSLSLQVRARAAGVVRNVGVTQGSWGEQGAPVILMSNPAAMEISGDLYSGSVPAFDAVRATMSIGRENVELEGTWRLSEQADAEKQTRTLFFTPRNLPTAVRPGQLCRMDLYNKAEEATVCVPDSAIVRVGMDDLVFVEINEETYAGVTVHAGESRRGMTPVEGLPKGRRIVVKGGQELRQMLPSAAASGKKPGHFHADGQFHEGEH